jgi:hypothetical protein
MNIYFLLIIIIFIIFIILYVTNNFILKNSYENFEKMKDGLLCGTDNDICRINEYNVSSCCKNYKCVRPKGIYQYKICIDKNKLSDYDLSSDSKNNSKNGRNRDSNRDSKFPKILTINLEGAKESKIFTKDYWSNMFDFNYCRYKDKILKEEEEKYI